MLDVLVKKARKANFADSDFKGHFSYCSELLNCLEPLLFSLGWNNNKRQLIDMLPHFSEALQLHELNRILDEMNFKHSHFDEHLDRIDHRLFPCLFIDANNHVYVIKRRHEHGFETYCGKTGRWMTLLSTDLVGRAYIYTKNTQEESYDRHWFRHIMVENKVFLVQILFVSLLLNLLQIAPPLFVMAVYDRVIGAGSIDLLLELIVGISITLAGIYLLQSARSKILAYLGAHLDNKVGNAIFSRIIHLPSQYTENTMVSAQIARVKDFDSIREFISSSLMTMIFEVPFIFIFIFTLYYLTGWLILIPLVMMGIFAVFSVILQPVVHKTIEESARTNSMRQSFLIEALNHMRTIKLCGAEKVWSDRFKNYAADAAMYSFRSSIVTSILNTISHQFMMFTALIIICQGVFLVIDNSITPGAMIATMILVWRILIPVKTIFSNLTEFDQVRSCLRQINLLMSIRPEREEHEKIKSGLTLTGDIKFSGVSIRYHQDMDPALFNVSFHIKPGEIVMITGNDGSGKTSLFKCLLRLYTPQAGNIAVDGKDIRQIDIADLRQNIGYEPQQHHVFYGTIAQNLRLSNPLANDKDLIDATKKAGIYDEIMQMPEGFDTRIRDNSKHGLSLAFIQALCLARCYVKKTRIILLDEPTCHLGNSAANQFFDTLESFRGHTTVMVVTHRPSLLRKADKVIYMHHGRAVFCGTYEELEKKRGQRHE